MYLLNQNELDKLELTELSALYNSLYNAKNSITDSQSVNPIFTNNQKTLLNMMINQIVTYATTHNYIITDTNLIIRKLSIDKMG